MEHQTEEKIEQQGVNTKDFSLWEFPDLCLPVEAEIIKVCLMGFSVYVEKYLR